MQFLKHNAIAIIALFVALSGTATAASIITSAQIKNGTITYADLSKSLKRKLTPVHTGNSSVSGPQGASGATGATGAGGSQGSAGQGLTGPQGLKGDTGSAGAANVTIEQKEIAAAQGEHGDTVPCPAGMHGVAGGFDSRIAGNGPTRPVIYAIVPTSTGVSFNYSAPDEGYIIFYATCAS